MSKINIRSPYFVNIPDAFITSAVLDLYIYTGVSVATMDEVMYSIETDAYNGVVSFEISQLIADYIDVTFDGSFDSNVVWVNYQVTKTIANVPSAAETPVTLPVFDGMGYFEDGANPQLSDRLLQSNNTIYAYDNNIFNLPIQQDNLDYIDLMYQGEEVGKVVTEGGQNLILYSEQADNAVWDNEYIDVTADDIAYPSGGYFGDKLTTTDTLGFQRLFYINQLFSKAASPLTYTWSCYVKNDEYDYIRFGIYNDARTSAAVVNFWISGGAFATPIEAGGFTADDWGFTDEGDGWRRVWITATTDSSNSIRAEVQLLNNSENISFIGDGVSGVHVRGMQLQEGALGTYVETTTVGVDNIGGTTYPNRISFTPTTDSGDVIRYVSYTNPKKCLSGVNYLFEDRNNYLFEDANNYIFNDVSFVDAIKITYTNASTETIKIKNISENKHTPYRLTFVNKFGALQSVWMFKRSDLSMSVENENYRGFLYNGSSYSVSEHQYRNYNIKARETISLNSGFYTEDYNEVFRQLLLSERVWIDYKDQILPVNIKSNELSFKTQVNDKLIDYKMDFEFAFDKINNVF